MSNEMPNGTVSVTAKIVGNLKVHITALKPDFQPKQAVYALNWFNSSWLWLYNFYNFLAMRSVLKVDGLPFFKARVNQVLHGDEQLHRSVLLIVRYPNITHFKTMLQSRYFQLVSIVRMIAVKKFTFSLSTRTDVQSETTVDLVKRVEESGFYAIHHYQVAEGVAKIAKQVEQLFAGGENSVRMVFSSQVSARLYSQQNDDPAVAVETIMDGCLLLQASSEGDIQKLISSEEYQSIIKSTKESYVATLNRIF